MLLACALHAACVRREQAACGKPGDLDLRLAAACWALLLP
jgi:hypothetical protein